MTHGSRPRVLIVDDDVHVLAALRRQLRHRYEVVQAEGASDGIERLRRDGPFVAVLSDLHMPGIDGQSFLAMARAEMPEVVAVLLTGGADAGVEDAGVEDGSLLRVQKPCAPDVLWAVLETALAKSRGDDSP